MSPRRLLAIVWLGVLSFWLSFTARAQSRDEYFIAADLDHDGRLSLAEFQDWMSWAFRQMDRNGDNVLDPEEQLVPNAVRLTLTEHHRRLAVQFTRQDRNGDGWLSQKEFLAPPQ